MSYTHLYRWRLVDGVRVELTFYDMMSCTPQCYPPIWMSVSPDCHWNFYETVQSTSVTYSTQRRISVPLWGCSTLPLESVSSWDEDGPPPRIRIGTEWILSPLPLPIGLAEDMNVGLSRLPSRLENRKNYEEPECEDCCYSEKRHLDTIPFGEIARSSCPEPNQESDCGKRQNCGYDNW